MILRFVSFLALLSLAPANAFALEFQYNKNHCVAREYQPKDPKSGGTGGLMDSTAWAETGLCLRASIEELAKAAADLGVMTWDGITKIVKVEKLAKGSPSDLFRVKVLYGARHKQLWCQSAEWPLAWRARVEEGSVQAPVRVVIEVERVPGGDSNGAYVKQMSAKIELVKDSDRETSLHMRYEVAAPTQEPRGAVSTITGYASRLETVAGGGRVPGAVVDPECPY